MDMPEANPRSLTYMPDGDLRRFYSTLSQQVLYLMLMLDQVLRQHLSLRPL